MLLGRLIFKAISFLLVGSALASQPGAASAQADSASGSGSVTIADNPAYVSGFIGVPASVSQVLDGNTKCPSGNVMLGLTGTRLKFISRITALCGTLSKDGSVVSITPLDPSAVAANATGFSLRCGSGKIVSGVGVAYHPNSAIYPYIAGAEIQCKSALNYQWSGAATYLRTGGFDGWPVKARVECTRQSQPARGIKIKISTSVTGLALICDEP